MNILKVVKALLLVVVLFINTVLCCLPLYFFSLLKLIPIPAFSQRCSGCANAMAEVWARFNRFGIRLCVGTRWDVSGIESLSYDQWVLVIANHQSWLDIVVLQCLFVGKIPFLKFFLKSQLKWVPLLGLAWRGLDFPFMKRYSKKALLKNPKLKGRDLKETIKSCENFMRTPSAVMNFIEGTRFTPQKHKRQASEYQHLLKPRAGGIGMVMSTMGHKLDKILDVTIVYPKGKASLWLFLKGDVPVIRVDVRVMDVEPRMVGNYFEDQAFQSAFKVWLNKHWHEKDQLIEQLKQEI
jgi:1-acyl-sn-glycerol-3-phosphate acyltransferase